MSDAYGVKYRINGHRTGFVQVLGGTYRIIFERYYEENTLEAIEAIDWKNVTVEKARTDAMKCPLPDGYTFRLERISYLDGDKIYVVTVRTDKQSYGDVTPYQEQLAAANAQLAELEAAYDAG